jgi:hypothetical protein
MFQNLQTESEDMSDNMPKVSKNAHLMHHAMDFDTDLGMILQVFLCTILETDRKIA